MKGDEMLIHEDYFKNIFNTVREAILILDENMRVLSANRSFFSIFKVDSANTIGSLLYDLGNGQWDIPHLRVLLEDILPKNDTVDDYEIEHIFESIGRKTMLLNARKIREKDNDQPIILLVIEDITERKQLEELLTETEERYRRLFETASDGIVLLEKSAGTIAQLNPAAENMLGYSEEECIGKNLHDIGVSIDMSDFPAMMKSLKKCGILNYDDVSIKTRSGQDIYTDIYMVDRATLAQCNIRDVTERKRSLEALLEASRYSHQIIESAQEGIIVYGTDCKYKVWNQFMEQLTSISAGEVLGRHPLDIFPFLDKNGVMSTIEKALAGEISEAIRSQFFIPKTGRSGWTSNIYAPLRNAMGEIIGVIGTVHDITKLMRADETLKEEKMFIENALNTLRDIFFVFDLEGRFLRWNKTVNDVSGYTDKEFALMKPVDLFCKDNISKIEKAIQTAIKVGSVSVDAQVVITSANKYMN
jgi:PAS domain S-box-containing protein